VSTPKVSVKDKQRALRQAFVVQSLGWQGALDYFARLTPEQKREYFSEVKS
jgi:hypothetical protein